VRSPAHEESRRITVVPPGDGEAVRDEVPTLVDEVELETARLASMRNGSTPAVASAMVSGVRHAEPEIEVEWVPEAEPLDPQELYSKYVKLLGAFTRIPIVTVPFAKIPTLSMDHRMGFLVALIDGNSTIEDLLDVASMPPREVLHALVTLRDLGIVAFRKD
jgi:hypothetical protein